MVSLNKPKSIQFRTLADHFWDEAPEAIPQDLRAAAFRAIYDWWESNPKVCEGKWYIDFPPYFIMVGNDGVATNGHAIGQTPFVGSWEILQDGTITGNQYGVS